MNVIFRALALACSLGVVLPGGLAQTLDPPATPPSERVTPTLPIKAQRPSLMIRRGDAELEWRTSYTHTSRHAVFIDGISVFPILVIGEIGVERTRKDTLITALAARYGVQNNLLAEVKVPFRLQSERYSVPEVTPPEERTVSNSGLGDIEGSLFYQLPRGDDAQIRWVIGLSVKSNTGADPFEIDTRRSAPLGSGFWNSKIGLTGVKIVDPAAVYWTLGYTVNWERKDIPVTVTDLETGEEHIVLVDVKPANAIEVGGGFAYAVNARLSVSTGLTVTRSGSSRSNGVNVPNSAFTAATLRLGVIWLTEQRRPVDLGLSIGLTDDSPDFSIEYRQNFRL